MARVGTRRKFPFDNEEEHLKKAKTEVCAEDSAKSSSGLESCLKRFVSTRISDVYSVQKSRHLMQSSNNDTKKNGCAKLNDLEKSSKAASDESDESPSNNVDPSSQRYEKLSQKGFRTVKDLSSKRETKAPIDPLDMGRVLKGIFSFDKPTQETKVLPHLGSNFVVPGDKAPVDLTLKTLLRVANNSSVNWIHRSIMASTYIGVPDLSTPSDDAPGTRRLLSSQVLSFKALHSWVYPQSVLPSSLISLLTSSAGGESGLDFMNKRHLEWEDSFRSLFYMFQKRHCNLFYVCTAQFIVMFMANYVDSQKTKRQCNAYISRSTRTLRSLLKEHNIGYSMPLSHSKEEQPKTEVLLELAEIEKQNFGQTKRANPPYHIDDTPQSLLSFCGNYSVKGLYDFLLNHRSSLNTLYGSDVPLLYSPIAFQNSAISAPQMKCVETKRFKGESSSFSSVEFKDKYIPPWILSRTCELLRSNGSSFDVSFVTDRNSIGLNSCLEWAGKKTVDQDGEYKNFNYADNEVEGVLHPKVSSGFLNRLKFNDGAYEASISST